MSFSLRAAAALAVTVTLGLPVGLAHAGGGGQPEGHQQVLVRYAAGTTADDQADLERSQRAERAGTVPGIDVAVLRVPAGAAERVATALTRSGRVDFAEAEGTVQALGPRSSATNDPLLGEQWGIPRVNAPTAWQTTTGSASTVLAVLDTGVDPNHTDLRGRLLAGYDYVNNDSNPADDNGHGTSVAGVAAANTNNAAGIAGACWSCSILPVKVLGASGSGGWAAVANGLTYAADRGAHVINLSLGGSSGSETLRSAVAYAQSKGAVVVAAAGNSGGTAQMFPAAYPGVVSVAGSQSNDSRYSWSQYGSWVKVAAPGCSPAPRPGGSYSTVCGTSFASPLVAGIAGLMRSANPSASATTVAGALQTTSTSVSYVQYGRVDAAAAVAAVTAPGTAPEPAPAPGPGTTTTFSGNLNGGGGSRSFTVDAGQGALSAALSFSRSPSMTVTLLDSSGRTLARAAGGSPVRLTADVAAGRHTLVVADGKGAFSLVVTHAS